MVLLKLVIVDDEPILLQGLQKTYDWESMGFEVAGTAQSGEQALDVIRRVKPHVVLTDIRMKQITGLMVMEEIQKENMGCLFIVLSAYRDFEYAQQACEFGAFAYLLKPIEDEKLQETMQSAYDTCIKQLENEAKYESWEKLLVKDSDGFLPVVVQKYVRGRIPEEKVMEVFETLNGVLEAGERFITVCVDIDLAYKITNSLEYEAARFAVVKVLEERIRERFFYWSFEGEEGSHIFIVRTKDNAAVREIKEILECTKKEGGNAVVAAISKPYKGIRGIKRSYDEAQKLFGLASISGASAFTIPEEMEEKGRKPYSSDSEILIVNAVRKNDLLELKEAFVHFIYDLPQEEDLQCHYMHRTMLKAESMIKDSYGMTEELKNKFRNDYYTLKNLSAAKAVDVCYKILGSAIEIRIDSLGRDETKYFKEYMSVAVAYIEEHLDDEALSIVSVASHVYLNPVYFGRVFKNTFHMTFKKYLMQRRMEKAKELLEKGSESIGAICEQVGISNSSYFAQVFKQYTGKLPSEYKKEFEV